MGKYSKWSGANKKIKFKEVYGLTTPLITTSSGSKWGKQKKVPFG